MTALARARLAVALLPVGLLLSVACSRDNTSDTGIIVEVSSDLRVPQDIDQVQLTATDPQGNQLYLNTFDLGEGPNRFKLPFRTGLYPLHDTATPIHVVAVGQLSTVGQPVASRSATLSFVHGKKVVLPLPLLAVCKGVACKNASLTCQANGQCDSDTVNSSALPTYVPDQPVPAPDAAAPVVPMDAAVGKAADGATDRTRDLATDVAGGRDTYAATGDAIGTDGGAVPIDGQARLDACVPETDQQMCTRLGGSCDGLSWWDNCGQYRSIGSCGTCPGPDAGLATVPDVAPFSPDACVAETDQQMCTRLGGSCGGLSWWDNCGQYRSIGSCGTCPGPDARLATVPDVAPFSPDACVAETNQQMCVRLGANCGSLSGYDDCGQYRSVFSCGTCLADAGTDVPSVDVAPFSPDACVAETNQQMCVRLSANCGSLSGYDNCGQYRSIFSCGACVADAGPDRPSVDVAPFSPDACAAETNQQMCIRLNASCGNLSGYDNCGQYRSIFSCGTCVADAGPDGPSMDVAPFSPDAYVLSLDVSSDACVAETNQQMCISLKTNCGSLSGYDNCGQYRSIFSCGTCVADGGTYF